MGRDRPPTAPFVLLAVAELAYFTVHVLPLHVTGRLGADEGAAGLAFGAFAVSASSLRWWTWLRRRGSARR